MRQLNAMFSIAYQLYLVVLLHELVKPFYVYNEPNSFMEIDESVLNFPLNMHEAKIAQRKHTYYIFTLFYFVNSVIPFDCVIQNFFNMK